MREEPLLHADHEDNRELEAFGRVQRHERHAVVLDIGIVDVGDERELREEGLEVRVLLRLLEVARDADELLEVLDARLVLRFLVRLELIDVTRLLEDPVDEVVELHVHVGVHEVEDEGREELEWLLDARRDTWDGVENFRIGDDVEERELLLLGRPRFGTLMMRMRLTVSSGL